MFKRPQEHFFDHLLLCCSHLRGPFSCVSLSAPGLYMPQIAPWFLAKSKEKPGHSKADWSPLKCVQERTAMSLLNKSPLISHERHRDFLSPGSGEGWLLCLGTDITKNCLCHSFWGSFLLLEVKSSFFSVSIEEINKEGETFSEKNPS